MKIPVTRSIALFLLISVVLWPLQVSAAEKKRGLLSRWTSRTQVAAPEEDAKSDAAGTEVVQVVEEGEAAAGDVVDMDVVIESDAAPELEKDEMVEIISVRLSVYPEIMNVFPNLSASETGDGEMEYFYTTEDGKTVSLIDLDKDMLFKLFVQIGNTAARLNAERIAKLIRQQEMIRNLQSLQNIPRIPASAPVQPPANPQTRIPAQPPRIPAAPPRVPAGPPRR